MSGEPTFESRLWVLTTRIWIAVAVAAFALAVKAVVRR